MKGIHNDLAYILRGWRKKQDRLQEFMGADYTDYNLALKQETGCPYEERIIGKHFDQLKKSAGLPDVVFHSLRHPYIKPTTKILLSLPALISR